MNRAVLSEYINEWWSSRAYWYNVIHIMILISVRIGIGIYRNVRNTRMQCRRLSRYGQVAGHPSVWFVFI